jgi:DNA-directed RNA polymerase subunit RPC12/RpoP
MNLLKKSKGEYTGYKCFYCGKRIYGDIATWKNVICCMPCGDRRSQEYYAWQEKERKKEEDSK